MHGQYTRVSACYSHDHIFETLEESKRTLCENQRNVSCQYIWTIPEASRRSFSMTIQFNQSVDQAEQRVRHLHDHDPWDQQTKPVVYKP